MKKQTKFRDRPFDPESDDPNFRYSNVLFKFDDGVIFHAIHNDKRYFAKHQKSIKKNIKAILEYEENTNFGLVEEDLFELLLFEYRNFPFPNIENHEFTFVDLFAGIGGFRLAMNNLGGRCVFSSEWDGDAQSVYYQNFGEKPFGDITLASVKSYIPTDFDLLCAGFPCQPFSKGGYQNGFEDTRGTLFFDICEIISKHKPKFIMLENVSNLVTHDSGRTYKTIVDHLQRLDYALPNEPIILSPDMFGVPILRPRIFIPCVRNDIAKKDFEYISNFKNVLKMKGKNKVDSIYKYVDPRQKSNLTKYEIKVLEMWDEFYQGINLKIIGFPIWADYFKWNDQLVGIPEWKANFIKKNQNLYLANKKFIDSWLKKYDNLDWVVKTHRKFEWQAGINCSSLFEGLIQFRPSGIRVKRPDKFSTLVAMNHQQIIGKYRRRISLEEAKVLQSFPKEFLLHKNEKVALKQLGNSVNIIVIEEVFRLIKEHYHA